MTNHRWLRRILRVLGGATAAVALVSVISELATVQHRRGASISTPFLIAFGAALLARVVLRRRFRFGDAVIKQEVAATVRTVLSFAMPMLLFMWVISEQVPRHQMAGRCRRDEERPEKPRHGRGGGEIKVGQLQYES